MCCAAIMNHCNFTSLGSILYFRFCVCIHTVSSVNRELPGPAWPIYAVAESDCTVQQRLAVLHLDVKGHANILNSCCFAPHIVLIKPEWMKCPGDFLLHTPLWEAKTQLVKKENYISKQAVSAGSDISRALSVHFLSTAKYLQVGKAAFLIFHLFLCKS